MGVTGGGPHGRLEDPHHKEFLAGSTCLGDMAARNVGWAEVQRRGVTVWGHTAEKGPVNTRKSLSQISIELRLSPSDLVSKPGTCAVCLRAGGPL